MKRAKSRIGATGTRHVAKKAAAVVIKVSSMASAASGPTAAAMSATGASGGRWTTAWCHLSTTTKRSSTPMPMTTKTPRKLRKGKKVKPHTVLYRK